VLFAGLAPLWGYQFLLLSAGVFGFVCGLGGWVLSRKPAGPREVHSPLEPSRRK